MELFISTKIWLDGKKLNLINCTKISKSFVMTINYKGFGKSKRDIVLWQTACIALIWVVWRERNARIFEDKARNSENLWDTIHFLASF